MDILHSLDSEIKKKQNRKKKGNKRQHQTIMQTKRLKTTNETFKTPCQIFTS